MSISAVGGPEFRLVYETVQSESDDTFYRALVKQHLSPFIRVNTNNDETWQSRFVRVLDYWLSEEPSTDPALRAARVGLHRIALRNLDGMNSVDLSQLFHLMNQNHGNRNSTAYPEGDSLLHLAAQYGSEEGIGDIVGRHPGDLNLSDSRGQTPLHRAVAAGQLGAADRLLTAGADVNRMAHDGRTPYDLAKDEQVAALLLRSGGRVGKRKRDYAPPPRLKESGGPQFRHHSSPQLELVDRTAVVAYTILKGTFDWPEFIAAHIGARVTRTGGNKEHFLQLMDKWEGKVEQLREEAQASGEFTKHLAFYFSKENGAYYQHTGTVPKGWENRLSELRPHGYGWISPVPTPVSEILEAFYPLDKAYRDAAAHLAYTEVYR